MNITKSSNPILKEQAFSKGYTSASDVMTVNGTINKTALMLLIVVAGALFTWNKFFDAIAVNPEGGIAAVRAPPAFLIPSCGHGWRRYPG